MLESAIVEQVKQLFSDLKGQYSFALSPSSHASQSELRDFLASLAACSEHLHVVEEGAPVPLVHFALKKDGVPTGISFRAIPGGHEFSSLVLAILNADGKGKLPDPDLTRRIKNLKGPIALTTYVSLSCTNCPDVVQALNVMALLHGDFRHEMVDGALVEAEVAGLGVQAVPSVFARDKLVQVGKSTFGDLLEKLEDHFGTTAADGALDANAAKEVKRYDVVVIGGGPAGAAAAIYSARKGLKTAVIAERIGGQVQETVGIENLISVTYTEGKRLAADLEKHLRAYPIDLLEHRKVDQIRDGAKKQIHLKEGTIIEADAVIIATGAKWRELGIAGEKENLGHGVAFCPHCDGPFYKGKRVAVVGGGNSGIEAAIDLAGICSHVTVLEFLDQLKADEVLVRRLRELKNTEVFTSARTAEIVGDGKAVNAIRYQDRPTGEMREVALEGVFVQIGLVPNSALVKELVETNRMGEIVIDNRCRSSVAGIYAAGDVTTVPYKQIIIAMGEGAKAALSAFEDRIRAA
jgi:NADH-dependent peroxiredoxin subunit F